MRRSVVRALLSLAMVPPAALTAQAPATISGTVTLAASGAPEAGVLIRIVRLGVGATSTADGRYRLVVPGGRFTPGDSVTVLASRVGLSSQARTLVLRGDTSGVDFKLETSALTLEGVVVTGTSGAVMGRAAGVSVSTAPDTRGRSEVDARAPSAGDAEDRSATDARGRAGGGQDEPGILTAGILDDFSSRGWREYLRFLARNAQEERWGIDPREVLSIRLRSGGQLLRDHPVVVRQGERSYTLRTRSDGTVRLFPGLEHRLDLGELTVTPEGGDPQRLVLTRAMLRRGTVTVDQRVASAERPRPTLDIGLLIDATGSMQDEMSYIQAELRDIVERVQPHGSPLEVRISVVYYRDRGDEFVTRPHAFDANVDSTVRFLAATRANGGGDYPEEMNEALRVMMGQAWSGGPAARMLFLVADAPPHPYADAQYTFHDALTDAGRKGISIFPVAASGVDRPTEYLMRTMAVATGGKYLFLTDDSGVGGHHLTPDQPFEVYRLNDLMVREIRAFVAGYYPELRGELAAR